MLARLALPLLLLPVTLPFAKTTLDGDLAALLAGVEVLERYGVPGTVCVYGPDAFAVLTANEKPEAVVAAARYGKGRAVAIAHGAYLDAGNVSRAGSDSARLFSNALRWTAGGDAGKLRVALTGRDEKLAAALRTMGHEVEQGVGGKPAAETDVVLFRGGGVGDAADQERLGAYVRGGGGLIAATCPWGYEQINAKRGLTLRRDLPENRVLAAMGLVFGRGYADATGKGGFSVERSQPRRAHAGEALDAVRDGSKDAAAGVHAVEKAIQSVPEEEEDFTNGLRKILDGFDPKQAPRPGHVVTPKDARTRLYVSWFTRTWPDLAVEDVVAAPGADEFPGAVPSKAKRVTETLRFDPATKGWQGTGLYLAPGDVLTVETASEPAGWRVRIGCHTDRVWHKDAWRRWPEIAHAVDLRGKSTRIATPFGGSVYFETTGDEARRLSARVGGAVAAPRYVLGDAGSAAAWKTSRKTPGPWAEIEGRHMVLSVPSAVVRAWNDPGPLIAWWDSVLATHCKLAGTPVPERRERFVADVQISAGYMHSGYPIMTHLDQVEVKKGRKLPPLLDLEKLSKDGTWGYFHELGHNRQKKEWTFDGTGEVTCNLFSLYTNHELCGIEPWENSWLANQKAAAKAHLAKGAPFGEWKRKPGVALVMYAQLQREFGWGPFERALAGYEALPDAERPKTNQARMDTWMATMSREVGRDLRPFFERWGVPLSAAARKSKELDRLKPWMPDMDDL